MFHTGALVAGFVELLRADRANAAISAVASLEGGSGGAVLVTRQEHRVTGLDLDGLVEVLRVLG